MRHHPTFETSWTDAAVAALLLIGATVYLASLPHNLGITDESYFLYEAKRIRDGEVMYRDIFQFITPLSAYLMAFLYWLFGTTMTTARVTIAVVHGLTCVWLYATARRFGVRRSCAVLLPLVFLAISQPAWPYASWHWFSTNLVMLLLLMLLTVPWERDARWALIPGIVNGLLIGTQQQRGVLMAVGVGVLLLLNVLLARRYGRAQPWRAAGARVVFFFAGVSAVVVPVLITFVVIAGFQPVFEALVMFPLGEYRMNTRILWGRIAPFTESQAAATFPPFLRFLPLALVPLFARAAVDVIRRVRRQEARALVTLGVLSLFSIPSILYYPDFIHIAFIAAPFYLSLALVAEWVLAAVRPARVSLAASTVLLALVTGGLGYHLWRNWHRAHARFAFAHETAFGRIDFDNNWEAPFVDATRRLLDGIPNRELFFFTSIASPYLTTGAKNPTPYQLPGPMYVMFFRPTFSPDSPVERVINILDKRRLPYLVATKLFMGPNPTADFVRTHYDPIELPGLQAYKIAYVFYARKDPPPP